MCTVLHLWNANQSQSSCQSRVQRSRSRRQRGVTVSINVLLLSCSHLCFLLSSSLTLYHKNVPLCNPSVVHTHCVSVNANELQARLWTLTSGRETLVKEKDEEIKKKRRRHRWSDSTQRVYLSGTIQLKQLILSPLLVYGVCSPCPCLKLIIYKN